MKVSNKTYIVILCMPIVGTVIISVYSSILHSTGAFRDLLV